MPDIGDQLRETRMRNRIDITEVEASTKIRAKYLRALENEEWDLLPGPAFVKTFLRTYADYLGLDARLLVEEFRQRYERPTSQELTPFAANRGGRRNRRRRPPPAPWMLLLAGAALLVGVLFLLGTWGDDNKPPPTTGERMSPPPHATPEPERRTRRARRPPATRVALQVQATGAVSVCLEDSAGRVRIANRTLAAGARSRTFHGRRFRASFGTGAAIMRVNGRRYAVSDSAPVGYEIRPARRPRRLAETERPTCAG